MCTHCKKVYNPYIQETVLVNCGHCKECLQDKADLRANRIRNSIPADHLNLFVTLTYDNRFLPVIKKSELQVQSDVPIYRYSSLKEKDKGKHYIKIGSLFCDILPYGFDAKYLRKPRHYFSDEYFSIPYFRDVQNFFKRLRVNLERDNSLTQNEKNHLQFKYYACTELGPTTHRGHVHLALTVHKECVEAFRRNIVKSWSFARADITRRGIEISRGCAQYVASYVNRDSSIPKLFSLPQFKPKHSYSHHYGVASSEFSAIGVLDKINKRTLTYNRESGLRSASTGSFLLPKYVLNRHFPLFKGYSRIPADALFEFLCRPVTSSFLSYWTNEGARTIKVTCRPNVFVDSSFTPEDIHKIKTSLDNHCIKFCNAVNQHNKRKGIDVKFGREDFFRAYIDAWKIYQSNRYRIFLEDIERNLAYFPYAAYYDNLSDIDNLGVRCSKEVFPPSEVAKYKEPNLLPSRVAHCQRQEDRYNRLYKRRKVTNGVMSCLGLNV